MGETLNNILALFGGGRSIPSSFYPGGQPEPMQGFEQGPPVPPRQGAYSGLSQEQKNILGFAALSDAFAALGGRQGQAMAQSAPLAQMVGEQAENERFRLANQQIRQQLFGGGQQGAAAAPLNLTPAQTALVGGGQAGFTPGGLAINTRLESDGRADAQSPTSSALGPNQFTTGTFLQFAQENPNFFQGMSRDQILAERTNPEISRLATQWYAGRNATVLQNAGIPVNDISLGIAHQFDGPVAARMITTAATAPNTPISELVSPDAIAANRRQLEGRTVGEVVGRFVTAYGGQQAPAQPGAAAVPGVNIPSQRRPMISEQEFNMYTSLLPARQANQAIIQAMMRPAPAPIVIEGTAYDPVTLRPLVTAPQRPGEAERFFEERRRLAAIPQEQRTAQQNEELELLNARLRGSGTNVSVNTERTFTGELGQQAVKDLTEARQAARIAPTLALRAERVNQLLNSGAITGTGANFFSSLANALTTAGIIPPDAAANTQMLGAELAGQALSASQLLKGPTSDRDILFLREASAGNITFNEQTIRRIARLNADLAERAVREYNDIVGPLQGRANIPEEVRAIYRPIDWQEELRRARELAAGSVVRTQPGAPTAPPPGSTIIPFQPPRSR